MKFKTRPPQVNCFSKCLENVLSIIVIISFLILGFVSWTRLFSLTHIRSIHHISTLSSFPMDQNTNKETDGRRILTDNQTSCIVKVRRAQLNVSDTKHPIKKG